MKELYEEMIKLSAAGEAYALVTVTRTRGSTPRKAGAKMLVLENGAIVGTVGGGCIEAEVWQEAQYIIRDKEPKLFKFSLTANEAEDSGMICGGIMEIFIEPILPSSRGLN